MFSRVDFTVGSLIQALPTSAFTGVGMAMHFSYITSGTTWLSSSDALSVKSGTHIIKPGILLPPSILQTGF